MKMGVSKWTVGWVALCLGAVLFSPSLAHGQVCCMPDNSCREDLTQSQCEDEQGGTWYLDVTCADEPCPVACCFADPGGASCLDLTVGDCALFGGTPRSTGSNCSTVNCPHPVVNLSWSVENPQVVQGRVIAIDLIATANSPDLSQQMGAVEMILNWDSGFLDLSCPLGGEAPTQCMPHCDVDWISSPPIQGFADDSGLDGLNTDLHDGDAFWQVLAQLGGETPEAPPEGICVGRFLFEGVTGHAGHANPGY